jgi:tRNA pseudouridine55 synthase
VSVELAERDVTVHRFEQRWQQDDRRAFLIECSSGTYVRSLIGDLGDAYCEALRRTRIGHFDVADADPERPVGVSAALDFLPEVRLDAEAAHRVAHGQAVLAGDATPAGAGAVRLTDADGLVALAERSPDTGALRPVVGFR